jgi:ubiquinone/menaquinone biosynthesis C-methylase UbiE
MQQPDNSAWHDAEHVRKYVERQKASSPIEAELFAVIARLLRSLPRRPERVLDLGCGAGRFGRAIMDVFDWLEVTFSDFSAEMLKAAREAVRENQRASFVEADLTNDTWADVFETSPFDVIVSGFSLHHLERERRREVIAELCRLLRPGGLLIVAEWVASPSAWLADVHNRWFVETSWHGGMFEGQDATFDQTLEQFANRQDIKQGLLLPMDEQIDWLHAAGYEDVSCFWKTFDMAVFGGRRPA